VHHPSAEQNHVFLRSHLQRIRIAKELSLATERRAILGAQSWIQPENHKGNPIWRKDIKLAPLIHHARTNTSTEEHNMKGNRTKGPSRVGNLGGNKTNHPSKDSIKMAFKIRTETARNLRENVESGHLSDFVCDAIDEKLRRDPKIKMTEGRATNVPTKLSDDQ
jgi:hypothetical protein